WFLNRNLDTGIDYSYITMIASRHDFGQEGDRLLLHAAWRYAEGWATDIRIETRKRQSNGFKNQLNFNETRLLWGLVYKY
ncbi:MAG TPA: hypothetical protein VL860_04270, partial [Planctomycetota bacterium]|nr:hypothetical protein [Planctomycetota bacterium]